MKQTSSSVTQLIILIMMLLLMMSEICSPARKGGSRRRGKHRKQHTGSTKLIAISPKMRAYYEHKDVSCCLKQADYKHRLTLAHVTQQGAEIVKSSFFDYEFDLGHKIVFICVAKGDPAPKITWYKEGIEIFQHPFVQVRSDYFLR